MVSNNKLIAQNASLLYVRMFLTMGISLYTSRVILQTLGITDFGIYNIVGGIIILFSFLNAALTTATQRFLSYSLGENNIEAFGNYFSISISCYLILSLILFFLSETIGLLILNKYLNIPSDRMIAANWVYQFSIIAFILQILRIPYHASIIANEKMSFFAMISILEAVLKLIIIYLLLLFSFDKLILYSILVTVVIAIVTLTYKVYCNYKFEYTVYTPIWNKSKITDFLSFSSWSLLGGIANLGSQQAINFILNIFWGVTVNAAIGVANQVTGAVYSFVTNFQTAFNPQIVKSYAAQEISNYQNIVFMATKISFFLLFTVGLPIIININYILYLWLGEIPLYTAQFVKMIFIYQLIDAISMPFLTCIQARGNIRNYQIIISILILCNIPLAFAVIKIGGDPYMVWFSKIVINLVCFIYRCYYVNKNVQIQIYQFFKKVLGRIAIIIAICTPFSMYIKTCFENNFISVIYSSVYVIIICIATIYVCGLTSSEKAIVLQMIRRGKRHER